MTTDGKPLPTNWFSRSPKLHWTMVTVFVIALCVGPSLAALGPLTRGLAYGRLLLAIPMGILGVLVLAHAVFHPWLVSKFGPLMPPVPPGTGSPRPGLIALGLGNIALAIGFGTQSTILFLAGIFLGPIIAAVLFRRALKRAA